MAVFPTVTLPGPTTWLKYIYNRLLMSMYGTSLAKLLLISYINRHFQVQTFSVIVQSYASAVH